MVDFAQLVWNGIATGSLIAVAALGLTLIIGIMNFLNLAYGEYLALGAFISWAANSQFGVPPYPAVLFGTVGTAIAAILMDRAVFKQFRSRTSFTLLVISIGLAFILRNIIRIIWGVGPKRFDVTIREAPVVLGVRVTTQEAVGVVVGITTLVVIYGILHYTMIGVAMRAAADNVKLAEIRGVDTEILIVYLALITGAVAGLAGSLIGIRSGISPVMGFELLLALFAAVVLGGVGNPTGAVVGGYAIGIVEELSVAVLPPSYKPAIGLIVLVAVLLLHPEGIFGKRGRI